MNEYLAAISSILVSLLPFFTPGIASVSSKHQSHVLAWGARLVVVSLTSWILISYLVAYFNLPIVLTAIIIGIITAVYATVNHHEIFSLPHTWYVLAVGVPLIIGLAAFAVPLLNIHGGLPTGDAQKAIFWVQDIIKHNQLPNYESAVTRLNRDPVDFYTPGLHTVTAATMALSPLPLITVSFFSIMCGLAVALVGAAISKDLFDTRSRLFPATLVALLILTNFRFLRFLREPGYHLQNSVGEILLFTLLMLGLSLIHRWRTREALLGAATLIALILTHQFSSFIGVFMLLPTAIIFLAARRHIFARQLRRQPLLMLALVAVVLSMLLSGLALGLQDKIPHIFTPNPHLLDELPSLADYPTLLGPLFISLGISGALLLAHHTWRRHPHYLEAIAFLGGTAIILALSQGPRIFIDVPPVRALLYAVVPLAITAGFLISKTIEVLIPRQSPLRLTLAMALLAVIGIGAVGNVNLALGNISHSVRTNATLTPGLQDLTTHINTQSGGSILADAYNRQSSLWLMLGQHPVFSRLAADGSRQMNEAKQSPLRQNLYINQLDFEKIFSLGNWPGIVPLLTKHDISYVTGITGSSTSAFVHNPNLQFARWTDDIALFNVRPLPDAGSVENKIDAWLLRPTTLANDIGDDDDTFNHMGASLQATRLSPAQFDNQQTYRVTRAPLFTARFNVHDYVDVLWDKDRDGNPDTALELYVRFAYPPVQTGILLQDGARLVPSASAVRLEPNQYIISSDGFIDITFINPNTEPVAIDMVALGLARVP